MVFGRSSVPSGGKVPPPVASLSPFRRSMEWVKSALGLQIGSPPQDLNTAQIIPILDAFQDGWPFATYDTPIGFTGAGPLVLTAGQIIVPADNTVTQRLLALNMQHSGGAGPNTTVFFLQTFTGAGGTSRRIGVGQVTLAVGARATLVDVFQSREIVVPPGFSLTADSSPDLIAAESLSISVGVQRIPAGFHPV